MEKIKNYFIKRFSKFTIYEIIISIVTLIMTIVGLYFSISMSYSISKGYTLFGNADNNNINEIEIFGPTKNDIQVISVFWILTILVFAFLIYYVFFYKLPEKEVTKKEIIEGKVVEIEEKKLDEDK